MSPTVSLEELFFTLIIYAHEGHDIATFDVPGTYLHVEMSKDKITLMKIRGYFVGIVCKVNPEHKQHGRYQNEKMCYTF